MSSVQFCLSLDSWVFSYVLIKHRKILKSQETNRPWTEGQTELNKILTKKSVLNEINKVGLFIQGFKNWRKIKRAAYQNLNNLQNLLKMLTVKASAEKALLLHELPSLNSGDKPKDAQTWKSYSSFPMF